MPSGWTRRAACSDSLLRPSCGGTRAARGPAFHGRPQDAVDARLVTPAVDLEPIKHVHVKANGELLFGWGPSKCGLFEKLIPERWDVRIVHSCLAPSQTATHH